jgi:hypothetical protein
MTLIAELKRRKVIRMAGLYLVGLYLVGVWLVVQVSSRALPMFKAPTPERRPGRAAMADLRQRLRIARCSRYV